MLRRVARGRCTFVLASAILPGLLPGQSLTVTPDSTLIDQSVDIRAGGLGANERVTITASLTDGDGQPWKSKAEFGADEQGNIDLSTAAPLKGSYKVASAMGLIWSMKPSAKGANVYHPAGMQDSQKVHFELLRDGRSVAAVDLTQRTTAEGVRQIKVTGELHGILVVPGGEGPFPGVLVLGGSEGGLPRLRAAWLASHGYAALALAYFRYENLPAQLESIPLEYFGEALEWMRKRPEIQPRNIGIVGVSRGGELALQLGSMFPGVGAIVAYVPASVRFRACCGGPVPAWTWKGEPLSYVARDSREAGAELAAIHVENMRGPLLLIGGQEDRVWNSSGMVKEIESRLKRAHFTYPVETLIYPHAGHIAGRPEIVPEWHGPLRHPVSGKPTDYGGTPEGNALSSIDAIPKVLDFLKRNLTGAR